MVEVLFSDNHILALNKPAGLLTQPNDTQDPSLEILAKQWVKEKFQKPGSVFLHAVHRLDRPVSGIVLFARTSKALSRLNEALRQGEFKKLYLAVIEGTFSDDAGILEHVLSKEAHQAYVADEGKKSVLKYRVLKRKATTTLIEVELVTGRYHQIRAQLSASGHPVVGDHKYGSQTNHEAILLHHASLDFPHPVSKEHLHLQAPLPAYWKNWD